MRNPIAWLAVTMLIAASARAGKLTLTIAGLAEDEERAARASLTVSNYVDRDVTPAEADRLLKSGDAQIRKALEPFGYYEAQVTHRLERDAEALRATFTVIPGAPVRISERTVQVCTDAAAIVAVARALDAFEPRLGDPLRHGDYEHSKAAIATALANAGYLTARLGDHRVEVRKSTRSAKIDLSWDCGTRYRFGPARFPSTPLSQTMLTRMVPWAEGDYYSLDQLLELQRRLTTAEYFATVAVQPQLDAARGDQVPVNVTLTPARRDIYSGSLYASTDTGAGVNLGFQRRWLNSAGHKLHADGDYAERLKAATLSYSIPFAGADDLTWKLGTTYRDEITDSTQERTLKFALNESRKWRGFARTLGVQLIGGDFEIGSEHGNSNELYAEASLTRSDTDDPVFPRRGYSVSTSARIAPSNVVSRTRFAAIDGRAKWITPEGRQSRVILRATLGAMKADDFDELPPELRFFAGGDRSIRGFDYEAIGSHNEAGDVIGGTYLTVFSAEYERYFRRKLGAAVFIDGGDAFLGGEYDWNVGAGIGARWQSPIGVIRLDVAVPIATELTKSVRVHLTIGPDL